MYIVDTHCDSLLTVNSERGLINYGGHGGGDYAIMYELVRYLQGDDSSISITKLDDSINSHLVVYAAEKSIQERKTIDL